MSVNDLCLRSILITNVMVWQSAFMIRAGFICLCLLEEGDHGRLLAGPFSGTAPGNTSPSENYSAHLCSAALDISVSGFSITFPLLP